MRKLTLTACLAAALLAAPAILAFEETVSSSADTLVFRNLIGEIEVEGHSGSDFQITIHVRGDDASADRVQIESSPLPGDGGEIRVRFPLDESRKYVYPDGPGSTTMYDDGDDTGWLSKIFGKGGIKVSRSGSGLEIWADAKVLVPKGKTLIVDHGVGKIHAHDIQGALELDTSSGGVEVDDVRGAVTIDTGSGSVTVADVDGDLLVDTGSGRVTVSDVQADKVHVDTGSGSVTLEDVDTESLYVDTGSGGVDADGVGADELTIDTGSGSVALELARMGHGKFEIDTGSGGIDLKLPADASAEVEADTGSGGVRLNLAGIDVRHSDDDEAEFVIGGGLAKMTLDTGSGSIRISQ
jgi:hypothetical protein